MASAAIIDIPTPRQGIVAAKAKAAEIGKKQLKTISKTAIEEVEKVADVNIGAVNPNDLKKFVDSLKKGDITAATSIALDTAIMAATATLGGVGALFGAAIIGLKHLFEGMIDEPSRDEISKRDLGFIVNQYLYPTLKNVPESASELDNYKRLYKLTYPLVDSANFLYGFLRTEFYEAILKSKKALPSTTGTYPKLHEVKYLESWKTYANIVRTVFYKIFAYPENKLIYPSDALVKKIKDAKTLGDKLALVPFNELWFWDGYWKTKDPGLKDRALGVSYSVFDSPPDILKKTPKYPIYDTAKKDVIYSSETGLPITVIPKTVKVIEKATVSDLLREKEESKKKKIELEKKEKEKKEAEAKKKKDKEKKETEAKKVKEAAEKKKKEKEAAEKKKKDASAIPSVPAPDIIHQHFVLWAALGVPYYA